MNGRQLAGVRHVITTVSVRQLGQDFLLYKHNTTNRENGRITKHKKNVFHLLSCPRPKLPKNIQQQHVILTRKKTKVNRCPVRIEMSVESTPLIVMVPLVGRREFSAPFFNSLVKAPIVVLKSSSLSARC